MDIRDIPIDEIGLSVRSANVLHRLGVHTVGGMMQQTEESLLAARNLGKKSVQEILEKIEEYRNLQKADLQEVSSEQEKSNIRIEDFDAWIKEKTGQDFIRRWLQKEDVRIDVLKLLSAKTYNSLRINDYVFMHQIVFLDRDQLMRIPRLGPAATTEIRVLCDQYIHENSEEIIKAYEENRTASKLHPKVSMNDLVVIPEYRAKVLKFVQSNDCDLRQIGLTNRAINRLIANGYNRMSDIIFLSRAELLNFPNMGIGSVDDILGKIRAYLQKHENRLIAYCTGDDAVLIDDTDIKERILKLYEEIGFDGLNLREMTERLELPKEVSADRLKKVIGSLLATKELEYVDFRCYRIYDRFSDCVEQCPGLDDRARAVLRMKLSGMTLQAIAQEFNVTGERIRQLSLKSIPKVKNWYYASTAKLYFDEDYYKYFYETYLFDKKDGEKWLGISPEICNYLDMIDAKRGDKALETAVDDTKGLDAGLRLKIKNYLNRNRVFIDGRWINKKRADIEEAVVRKYCTEDIAFDAFPDIYNRFLEQEEIPYDEDIYYTDAVRHTRKNRLSDARFLLWKQNERMRYYDIDGRDYTELFEGLNLKDYENVELSTLYFVEHYPEILQKYDIRDQYELHNLLRKTIPSGSFHDLQFGKMPIIKFGEFDRDSAIMEMLFDNAPISAADLCSLIHQEYGYDIPTIQGNCLQPFSEYYHQGIYTIDQKVMPAEHMRILIDTLTEDFYFTDEIRKMYTKLFPEADREVINPYNLKRMGFTVFSRYILRNHDTLESFFEDILTREDVMDITPIKKRYTNVAAFYQTLNDLKRRRKIIEFEPDQIINIKKLEQSGITNDQLDAFCDDVFDFVEDETYFSAVSLKQDGFDSDLYDLGFPAWFYANLLTSDERFSYSRIFGSIILYKGTKDISIKSFESDIIRQHVSIDVYDLMSELTDYYGCRINDRLDLIYKVRGSEIYYDSFLDRLYANEDLYEQEVFGTENE